MRRKSASMSSMTRSWYASTASSRSVVSVTQTATSSVSCVSQYETWRRSSDTNRSISRIDAAAVRTTISGSAASALRSASMSELRAGHGLQEVGDRDVHDVDQRLRPEPHAEHRDGEHGQQPEFAPRPKITRLYIHSVYAAPRINVTAAAKPSQKSAFTAARITRNSPTNPEVPGNPAFAIANSIMNAANFGIVLTTPP